MSYHGWVSREYLEQSTKSEDAEVRLMAKQAWTQIHQNCDHAYGICSG